ncbi:MAG: hypothetical protein H6895_08965 [Defluviimonas sp.]|uniref:hypothetical protein n=1 Tax=Albidovulum sp. TaxID=1872424 RepID=UPI001D49F108|nr:hypothetical protein [Paracoccaceae bacterium]MCC0064205.1 hypothetical protein [Defluviimonas sp.]
MSDITEFERRISAALARIGAALDQAGPAAAPAGGDASAALTEALEAERTANAQLNERVRAIKDKQERMVASLEQKVAHLSAQLDANGQELQRLKRLNIELTETNRALAASAEAGVAEPHLINRAMMSELDALRAARAAEVAELDEILSELRPLIEEVA